jgi:hypothetical protein
MRNIHKKCSFNNFLNLHFTPKICLSLVTGLLDFVHFTAFPVNYFEINLFKALQPQVECYINTTHPRQGLYTKNLHP